MVGKIGKGVEREGVRGISFGVVVGNKGMVVFEDFEPVLLFLLRRICFSMLFAPSVELIGGEGR